MIGPVDFDRSVEYWQQDKWNGCFPLKWHIVKDVPNNLLRHITLDNNENKPVTNSRDTQEVIGVAHVHFIFFKSCLFFYDYIKSKFMSAGDVGTRVKNGKNF